MKKIIRTSAIFLITTGFLASCSESRKKAGEKLEELNQKTEEFHSALDDGLQNIETLDSVVRTGTGQIKKYDSLVRTHTSKIDSVAKEKAQAWEDLTTF